MAKTPAPAEFTFGAHASPEDGRDHHVASYTPAGAAPLPPSLDFRGILQAVTNQGAKPACTGHAIVGVLGYLEQVTPSLAHPYGRTLSPDDAYDPVALPQGGAYLRDVLKNAQRVGVAQVGKKADTRAQNRIAAYAAVPVDVVSLQTALYWHGPQFGMIEAREGFTAPDEHGRVTASGKSLGGHAVDPVGYEVDPAAPGGGWWIVRNSWGAGWGAAGYCLLPFTYPWVEVWSVTQGFQPDGRPVVPAVDWWTQVTRFLQGGV